MNSQDAEMLNGGNMNSPKRIGDKVHRKVTESTKTIHKLLTHVRSKGIDWVPKPYGINDKNEDVVSFIQGDVPHSMPLWIWNNGIIEEIAKALRQLHDATADFKYKDEIWQFETKTNIEVICHNDFAPYNIVFANEKFKGVIDFDLCSPGSRLWDIAYTLYRFVPVMPIEKIEDSDEVSPFEIDVIINRIELFINNYSSGDDAFNYKKNDVVDMMSKRLNRISEWTRDYANQTNNEILKKNSEMYKRHSIWVKILKEAG